MLHVWEGSWQVPFWFLPSLAHAACFTGWPPHLLLPVVIILWPWCFPNAGFSAAAGLCLISSLSWALRGAARYNPQPLSWPLQSWSFYYSWDCIFTSGLSWPFRVPGLHAFITNITWQNSILPSSPARLGCFWDQSFCVPTLRKRFRKGFPSVMWSLNHSWSFSPSWPVSVIPVRKDNSPSWPDHRFLIQNSK